MDPMAPFRLVRVTVLLFSQVNLEGQEPGLQEGFPGGPLALPLGLPLGGPLDCPLGCPTFL